MQSGALLQSLAQGGCQLYTTRAQSVAGTPFAGAIECGRVQVTGAHLAYLETHAGTIDHFVDVLYDTCDNALVRTGGCWLTKRQGIHLGKGILPLRQYGFSRYSFSQVARGTLSGTWPTVRETHQSGDCACAIALAIITDCP